MNIEEKKFTPHKKHRSVFLKLFVIMMLTAILVHVIMFVIFGLVFKESERIPITRYKSHYAHLLTMALGPSPEEKIAGEMAQVYSVNIRYEAANKKKIWSTSESMPAIDEVRNQLEANGAGSLLEYDVVDNPDGSAFLFKWQLAANVLSGQKFILVGEHVSSNRRHIIIFITMAMFAFIGAFLFILYVLSPIKKLREAVNRIADGHLDVEVHVKRNDELGHLAFAFNQMSRRIKEMIKSRDQLLADVSHELRSPVTRIKLALEFMPENEKKQGMAADLAELENMITVILESERMRINHSATATIPGKQQGGVKLKQSDIIELINETVKSYEMRAPGVLFHQDEQVLIVKMDTTCMKIALQNILENAIKYSNPDSQPVRVSIIQEPHELNILIKDDGIGIPEEELPFLFEPFYRVDRSRSKKTGGYGLGLGMCKRIMTAHNGSIRIANNDGNGMTVQLTLPII